MNNLSEIELNEVFLNIYAAKLISRLAHKGQKYGGVDYFDAHVAVVEELARATAQEDGLSPEVLDKISQVAYLHDVLEDTKISSLALQMVGFDETVLDAVELLTRRVDPMLQADEPYFDYILRAGSTDLSLRVKSADLTANLAANPPESLRKRYKKALNILQEIRNEKT